MSTASTLANGTIRHWVVLRPEPAGQFTARAAGLPDIAATAATREDALQRVHELLQELADAGQLVAVEVQAPAPPLLRGFGRIDPSDPQEQAYLEELARLRQEDLVRTSRELDSGCSDSSSTPTT